MPQSSVERLKPAARSGIRKLLRQSLSRGDRAGFAPWPGRDPGHPPALARIFRPGRGADWRTAREALAAAAADPGEPPHVRGCALELLAVLIRTAGRSRIRRREVSLLLAAMSDPEPVVRFWACYGSGCLKIEAARTRLQELAANDRTAPAGLWAVSVQAKWALAEIDGLDSSVILPRLPVLSTPVKSHGDALRRAIALAAENVRQGRGGPFGAVIVRGGAIIAEGVNRVTCFNDPTAHAEVAAIRDACRQTGDFNLSGCSIYSSCEPCPMCLGAIYWARLDRLYFAATREDAARAGFDDSFLYSQIPLDVRDRALPTTRLLGAEGRKPFRLWEASAGKIRY